MKKLLLLATVLLLYGCPGEDDCDDFGRIAEVPDLIVLNPVAQQYRQGETITMTLEFPSINNYFNRNVNLLEQTGDNTANLLFTDGFFLEGNQVMVLTGAQGESFNSFDMPYNAVSGNYELKVVITLNKLGIYSLNPLHNVIVQGAGCNRFFIDTNINGTLIQDFIFEVIP